MTWQLEFVELDKRFHDRESFDCGKETLNNFIQQYASKHKGAGLSRTYLLASASPLNNGKYGIAAFYAIAPASIARNSIPEEQRRKLPHYPIPVFLLAQLAVHSEYQSQGLGKICLINALERLLRISREIAAYAVVVDCIDDVAADFYRKYGFEDLRCIDGRLQMFLPMRVVEKLFS